MDSGFNIINVQFSQLTRLIIIAWEKKNVRKSKVTDNFLDGCRKKKEVAK